MRCNVGCFLRGGALSCGVGGGEKRGHVAMMSSFCTGFGTFYGGKN